MLERNNWFSTIVVLLHSMFWQCAKLHLPVYYIKSLRHQRASFVSVENHYYSKNVLPKLYSYIVKGVPTAHLQCICHGTLAAVWESDVLPSDKLGMFCSIELITFIQGKLHVFSGIRNTGAKRIAGLVGTEAITCTGKGGPA